MAVEGSTEGVGRSVATPEVVRRADVRRRNDLDRDGTQDQLEQETREQFKQRWARQLGEVDAAAAATWTSPDAREEVAHLSDRATAALVKEKYQSVEAALAEAGPSAVTTSSRPKPMMLRCVSSVRNGR